MKRHIQLAIAFLLFINLGAHAALPKMDPATLASRINGDASCTQFRIAGTCGFYKVLVLMYVPVAFLETVGAPGDTLVAAPNFASMVATMAGAAFKVGQSNMSGTDNSWESKVWVLPDSVMLLSPIQPKCLTCMPSDSGYGDSGFQPAPSSSSSSSSGCDATNVVTDKIQNMGQSFMTIPFMPRLAYTSEADFLNWRTGCRDQSLTNYMAANAFTCTASSIGDLMNRAGGSNPFRQYLGDACLGSWGALYPRQMRDVGNVATVASAKTAYRALSVAKTQLGSVRFPVNMDGKMQQAYPSVSACFRPGESPLPQLPLSSKPVTSSPDGAYGWIYWRPVACCVSFSSIGKCASSLSKSN